MGEDLRFEIVNTIPNPEESLWDLHSGPIDSSEKIKFLTKLMNDDDWELFKTETGVLTERKFIRNSDIACFRSSGFVYASPEDLLNYVSQIYDSFESIKQYDNDVTHYEVVVDKLTDDSRLCYQVNSLSWPIWSRDVLYVQMMKKVDDSYWLVMYSVESPIRPIQADKYVRAVINISAYGFTPENDGCRVCRIAHIDPQGSIPVSVINSYADKTSNVIKRLQQIYSDN